MKPSDAVSCATFPCSDVRTDVHLVPALEIDPAGIKIIMISEAPPSDPAAYFYAPGDPFYLKTTMQAFGDAGVGVRTMQDITALGIYLTTAIKCAKTRYAIAPETMRNCSSLLEKEISLFPNASVFLLMGDTAVRTMNYMAVRQWGTRVIPAGSTYKIRTQKFYHGGRRFFPSYVQTGGNYLIEKRKREMIAEDLKEALRVIRAI